MLKRWLVLAAAVIAADQYTKWLVLATLQPGETVVLTPFFNWTLTFNPGASFSFLAHAGGWQRWLFTGLALAVAGWILLELRRHAGQRLLSLALTLIMGGALGNVIDRMRFGAVVDFIQVHAASWYFPAFNVADSAISIGAVLLIWEQMRQSAVKDQPAG
jgi:signal peptidase II